jgi:hypothetical protein
VECLNTKYKEAWFVNIIQSQGSNQTNMQSTNYTAAKTAEELNQSNRNSNTKKKAFNTQKQDEECSCSTKEKEK